MKRIKRIFFIRIIILLILFHSFNFWILKESAARRITTNKLMFRQKWKRKN